MEQLGDLVHQSKLDLISQRPDIRIIEVLVNLQEWKDFVQSQKLPPGNVLIMLKSTDEPTEYYSELEALKIRGVSRIPAGEIRLVTDSGLFAYPVLKIE